MENDPRRYDVFIAFHRARTLDAKRLRDAIQTEGSEVLGRPIRAAVDVDATIAGEITQNRLQEIQKSTRITCILVAGDNQDSPYVAHEITTAVGLMRVSPLQHRIVPVVLAYVEGPPDLPPPLSAFTNVTIAQDSDSAWATAGRTIAGVLLNMDHGDKRAFVDAQRRAQLDVLDALLAARLPPDDPGWEEWCRRVRAAKGVLRLGGAPGPGDRLGQNGRWELIHQVGAGGGGAVWRAYDRDQASEVALKILDPKYRHDRRAIDAFFRGSMTVGSAPPDGIVPILDTNLEDEGYYFYTLRYIDGPNLHEAVVSGLISFEQCFTALVSVARAMNRLHDIGVVHRDIKPANVVLASNGQAWLIDFDHVFRAESTGITARGTLAFAAPELDGPDHDPSTRPGRQCDQFSIAASIVFAFMRRKYPARGIQDRASEILSAVGIVDGLKRVLLRALDPTPTKRYETLVEFAAALENPPETLENPPEMENPPESHPARTHRPTGIQLEHRTHWTPTQTGSREMGFLDALFSFGGIISPHWWNSDN